MNAPIFLSISQWRNILFLLGLSLFVQSCSGSQLGKRLADSFDKPIEPVKSSELVKANQSKNITSKEKKSEPKTNKIKPSLSLNKTKSFSKIPNQSKISSKGDRSFHPQPYRIILRVPNVNPSAPAETVTRALRNAGVIFEVEKIERFDKNILVKSSKMR